MLIDHEMLLGMNGRFAPEAAGPEHVVGKAGLISRH
jgi:hypothetical protein